MPSDYHKLMGNIRVVNGRLTAPDENEPPQYQNRGYPYMNPVSTRFYQEYAKYATDYLHGKAQGLTPGDFFNWENVTVRMADLVKTSAAMQRQFDNHKMVLFDKMRYAYIPRGCKLETMGSTWLCTNPMNISGSDGIGVFQRCNVTWNHLDWYGNVVKEPVIFETEIARANAPDPQYQMNIVKGYFNLKCQYNEDTAQINDNTRIILGSACYVVTGYSDFEQEFTGDYDSVHFLSFTVRKDEVDHTKDDMENHVAGGLVFAWDITVNGASSVAVGETAQLTASSIRCGEPENTAVYLWSTSDENVATIDENGVVTGISDGECTITATLKQNPNYSQKIAFSVASQKPSVAFDTTPPDKLSAYESVALTVTGEDVEWSFSGADPNAYSAVIKGNTATVTCWSGSVMPLIIKASSNGNEVQTVIPLEGV